MKIQQAIVLVMGVIVMGIIAMWVIAMGTSKPNTKKPEPEPPKRVNVVQRGGFGKWDAIIEIDSHEYYRSYEGGVVHLESCQCKKPKP